MAGPNLADELRRPLIEALAGVTQALVLDPAAAPTDKQRQAFGSVLAAYEDVAQALSRSSAPGYTFRDLPDSERALYEGAKHHLSILNRLHGPQAG